MATFSKRHRRALTQGQRSVDLELTVRGRIWRLFERHSESYRATDETGWNYDTDTISDVVDALFDAYGTQALPHVTVARDLHAFIQGAKGEEVFDAVELFVEHRKSSEFVSELNNVLVEEDVSWRMLGGEMVLLDADFARDELAAKANGALQAAGFEGAIRELRRAREHLVDGDERAAIHSAGSSFEGVLMALLGRDEGTAKRLLQELTRGGYFDGLPTKLRERFVQSVMQALPWMRNSLGGHGQGAEAVEIPRAYAELATDLAAAFNSFLITIKLELEGRKP
ncbi:MAG TPA: hypothetical protein VMR96_01750, partial [Solirubrobacterales bacterium]|nr:hypothetical protein [Solirubrobacterales bacterium]